MATPVTPQTLYTDCLESTIGTLLLIHDREGHVRALDFHDFESRMRRLLRLHYGAEGNDFAIEDRAAPAPTPLPLWVRATGSSALMEVLPDMAAASVGSAGCSFTRGSLWRSLLRDTFQKRHESLKQS